MFQSGLVTDMIIQSLAGFLVAQINTDKINNDIRIEEMPFVSSEISS